MPPPAHDKNESETVEMTFSKDFLLGAATAAHQVEGNNVNSDDWVLERMEHTDFTEPSGIACDHYHRYEEDIRLLAEAGLNAYRFSIEWARIEPEEGSFNTAEIEHYRDVLRCCKQYGVAPIVTLHHFTSPVWLIRKGGWEAESTVEDFRRYCLYVVEQLGGDMRYVCTINEANMGLQIAAVSRRIMAQMRQNTAAKAAESGVQVGMNFEKIMAQRAAAAQEKEALFGTKEPQVFVGQRTEAGDALVMRAHAAARDAIKAACPHLKVGLTLSLHDIQVCPGGEARAAKEWEEEFRHYLPIIINDDFLGVQNYTRSLIGPEGQLPNPDGAEVTQMGYEFYPQGLEHVLRKVARDFKGELLVTENGIATGNDSRRCAFIEQALAGVQSCIADGLPVKGYCYWSLLDNFEWQKGYSMTFGLIAVDRETQARHPKESLRHLGGIRTNITD